MSAQIIIDQVLGNCKQTWNEIQTLMLCVAGQGNVPHSIGQCYYEFNALTVGYAICILLIVYCFVWSIIGNNCSKVDQIWSIAPVLYCWHFYFHYTGLDTSNAVHYRLLLLSILATLWGARLTFNFWRKDGYGTFFVHEEDYRWPILRAKMHPAVFLLFNFSFIAVYQNLLLYWIAVPAYEVMKASPALTAFDASIAVTFAALLAMETLADEQHWAFQQAKHALTAAQRSSHPDPQIRQGFFQSGLFKYSRHPNYFAEQSMWVCVYLFSLSPAWNNSLDSSTTDSSTAAAIVGVCTSLMDCAYVNWTCLGCLQLILLFQGSMAFGESITRAKYPEYAQYQQTTSQCIPLPAFASTDVKKSTKVEEKRS